MSTSDVFETSTCSLMAPVAVTNPSHVTRYKYVACPRYDTSLGNLLQILPLQFHTNTYLVVMNTSIVNRDDSHGAMRVCVAPTKPETVTNIFSVPAEFHFKSI